MKKILDIDKKEISKKIKFNLFSNFKIKLICFALSLIMFFVISIFQLGSRTFTSRLKIDNLRDFLVISNDIPDLVKIEIKERKNVLDKITVDDFNVRLDLSKIETTKDKVRLKIIYDIPSQMSSLFGSIKTEPEYIDLNIEKLVEKKVTVEVDTVGKPENGYTIKKITIEPSRAIIQGPKTILDKINSVKTEAINIDGLKESFSIEVNLSLDYKSVKSLKKVNVSFEIIKDTDVYTFETNKIYFENLKNQFKAETETEIQIKLEGSQSEINNALIESLSFYVDCSSITKQGDYELYIRVKNPNYLKIISITPERINVKIKNK